MTAAAPIHLQGERLMLDPAGGLFWPATRLLIVSDLHLEKGSSFAPRGMLLPPWDSKVTLDRLARLLRHWGPRVVVALGDSFHDTGGAGRLAAPDQARIQAMTRDVDFVWVLGNHDPAPPEGVGGRFLEEMTAGPFLFRHQGTPGGTSGEISGHHHPKAVVPARGGHVTRPCFVTDSQRVVMPAFGAYTGGLDVRHPSIIRLFPRGGRVFLLGKDRLFSFPLSEAKTGSASATRTDAM